MRIIARKRNEEKILHQLGKIGIVRRSVTNLFQLRELYTKAVYTSNLTDSAEYKECLKLLEFLSKEEMLSKLKSIMEIVKSSTDPAIKKIKSHLKVHIDIIREASLQAAERSSNVVSVEEKLSRMQLKEVCV